jgi:putative DNA primase/helicase
MNNYDNVMQQLDLAGLVVQGLDVDGRVHRCRTRDGGKERRGWYLLHAWKARDGNEYVVGSYGVWQGNEKNAVKVELDGVTMDPAEAVAMRQRQAEDRKRAQAQREAEATRAARRAASVWGKALKVPPADVAVDYLARKGVASYGLRYTPTGALVVPMMDARGDVKGLQFILPSGHPRVKATGRDKEYWPAGMSKVGHWYQIGSAMAGALVLVAEGYATAATLHAATGLAVAVAFDAGNLAPVARALQKAHKGVRVLVCADDDYLQKCHDCHKPTAVDVPACGHCGQPHGQVNPGCAAASAAALAVGGSWVAPVFPGDRGGKKLTDFNDLQHFPAGGLPLVRAQIEAKLGALGWAQAVPAARVPQTEGGGDDGEDDGSVNMVPRISVDDAVHRYVGTYGMGGKAFFDNVARRIVHKDDVLNLLPSHGWENLKSHPHWRVVYDHQIGFDPTNIDPAIKCNLWAGWPVLDPAALPVIDSLTRQVLRYDNNTGSCMMLLDLLYNMCSNEANQQEVYTWMLRWLAYPLQHPGAKMQSAIVVHGPQGTGKSRFFEAYGKIFGKHARVLGQEALEDKFNADWAEARQFILADEVMARADMYHIKNRLKGMITSETIRVNPKNVAAHNERNCMNIVFLSNERMPLVLEEDDRRYCVIWVPPKPDDSFFDALNAEIDNGGVVALHDYLLRLDLGDFKPWTKPPMTNSKKDLTQQSLSSEDRFITAWLAGDVEGHGGEVLPFCPCLGSHLYQAYEHWCSGIGERSRRAQELIGLASKRPGWHAGKTQHTWTSLVDPIDKVRKMVVPSDADMAAALKKNPGRDQAKLMPDKFDTKAQWMTAGVFAFETALGSKNRGDYP